MGPFRFWPPFFFPRVGLEVALERAKQLYEQERGNAAHLDTILRHWHYKGQTGPGRVTFSALRKFGLLDTEGSGTTVRGRLSELSLRILQDRRPESPERDAAIREAALTPQIHRELWERYAGALPSDINLDHELRTDRGFTDTGAQEFIREFRSTIAFARLTESGTMSSGRPPSTETNEGGDQEDDGRGSPAFEPPPNPRMQSMILPLAPGENAVLQAAFPLTESKWAQLNAVLTAMKPALVGADPLAEHALPSPPGPGGDSESERS